MSHHALRIILLLSLLMSSSCDKAPTDPGFPYAGSWTGYWKDYYMVFINGVPLGSDLTLNIGKNGSASASGLKEIVYADGTLTDRISMTLNVLPDGSVHGTGVWTFVFSTWGSRGGEGEVLGQLDIETGEGSGDLVIDMDGILIHFPWRVEKVK